MSEILAIDASGHNSFEMKLKTWNSLKYLEEYFRSLISNMG
jgi:hypothetical protein